MDTKSLIHVCRKWAAAHKAGDKIQTDEVEILIDSLICKGTDDAITLIDYIDDHTLNLYLESGVMISVPLEGAKK